MTISTNGKYMTDAELMEWAQQARNRAVLAGLMHPIWDLIFDAEAHAQHQTALLDRHVVERLITEDKAEHP